MPTTDSRTFLITGGSFGLGRSMAAHLVSAGHTVWVCGRDESRLADVATHLPRVRTVRADVGTAEGREALIAAVTAGGTLDVLVNNAAVSHAHDYTNPFTLERDRASEEVTTNFVAPIELTRLFLRWRREADREGSAATIAMISTPGALFPLEANPIYSSSKAGLHSFTRSLRYQLRNTQVSVVEVFPPALATGLTPELDVPAEDANGPDAVDAVAAATVEGILRGDVTVLPHPQAEQLHTAFAREFSDNFMTKLNSGVTRKAGWDVE